MKDNLSIVITIIIFVLLIIIFPLYNYFERQDDMSYNLVLKATTNFVDEVLNCGYIDQDNYNKFVNTIAATGNVYDIELEAHRKILIKNPDNLSSGEYIEEYSIDYNDQIFEPFNSTLASITSMDKKTLKTGSYNLEEGDGFYVKLKNSNMTMAGSIFNSIIPTSKKERITVNYGGVIKNNSWKEVASTYIGYDTNLTKPQVLAYLENNNLIADNSYIKPQKVRFDVKLPEGILESSIVSYTWLIIHPNGLIDTFTGIKSIEYDFTNYLGKYRVLVEITDQFGDKTISPLLNFEPYIPPMVTPVIVTNPYIINASTIKQSDVTFSIANTSGVEKYLWTVIAPSGTRTYTTSTISFNLSEIGEYIINVTVFNMFNDSLTSANLRFTTHVHSPTCYIHQHTSACYTVHQHTSQTGSCYTYDSCYSYHSHSTSCYSSHSGTYTSSGSTSWVCGHGKGTSDPGATLITNSITYYYCAVCGSSLGSRYYKDCPKCSGGETQYGSVGSCSNKSIVCGQSSGCSGAYVRTCGKTAGITYQTCGQIENLNLTSSCPLK